MRVLCQDRAKLFFDLVCTFVDLDFDIFHATLDAEPPAPAPGTAASAAAPWEEHAWHASVEFYVRPRLGGPDYDDVKGRRLAEMLKAAITRGAPVGQEIRLFTRQVSPPPLATSHPSTRCARPSALLLCIGGRAL